MITVRPITIDDAQAFLDFRRRLDRETKFMLLEAGERQTTIEEQRDQFKRILSRDNQMLFVAESDEGIVGYLFTGGGLYRRNRHRAEIVVGILEKYRGQGIGTRLFEACERWARAHGLHRLELTVMTHNERGITLYKKMGFEVEGIARHALSVDGEYVDEYWMGKLLT